MKLAGPGERFMIVGAPNSSVNGLTGAAVDFVSKMHEAVIRAHAESCNFRLVDGKLMWVRYDHYASLSCPLNGSPPNAEIAAHHVLMKIDPDQGVIEEVEDLEVTA